MKSLIAALVLASAAILPTAHAQGPGQISVRVSGLDMTRPESGAYLLDRIREAAHRACVAPGFNARQSTAGCMRNLIGHTVRELNIPAVTAALEGRDAPVALASR